MKFYLKLGLTLLVFCIVASGILAYVDGVTKPIISERKASEQEQTRKELLPEAKTFEMKTAAADSSFVYYIATNEQSEIIGFSFVAAKRGYSSVVKTMVATNKDLVITAMKVIDQNETPGLGTHAVDPDFPERFLGLNSDQLKVDKDGGGIKSITGATITTRTVSNSIKEAILIIKADLENTNGGGA
jgi:electron transport complex protein RnfG